MMEVMEHYFMVAEGGFFWYDCIRKARFLPPGRREKVSDIQSLGRRRLNVLAPSFLEREEIL